MRLRFADDGLENWLQRTPFALKPEGNAFADVDDQQREFEDTIIELLGLRRPHLKKLERELNNDHILTQLKRQHQHHATKDQRYTQAHSAAQATEAEKVNDGDYLINRYELKRLAQQIDQRTQEITQHVEYYNARQQQEFADASETL